jgi:hypothetical protein
LAMSEHERQEFLAGVHVGVISIERADVESFPLGADPSQSLLTYTPEPGSPSQDALNLLASWAATTEGLEQHPSTDDAQQAEAALIEPPD